jgi:hypothetical protein
MSVCRVLATYRSHCPDCPRFVGGSNFQTLQTFDVCAGQRFAAFDLAFATFARSFTVLPQSVCVCPFL